MKKILFLAVAAMMGCAAWAGHMSLRIPEAEMPARIIAAQQQDTTEFLPGVTYCRYMPNGNQQGLYYMVLSMLEQQNEAFPQLQLHMLVADTLAISHEGNILTAARFYQSESAGGNAIDADVNLQFVQYDTIAGAVYAKYDIVCLLVFEKHEPILGKYLGYVTFISDATNKPYVPLHEQESMGIMDVTSAAPAVRKVLRNGQVLLEVSSPSGLIYLNAQGQQVH